jgi:hypothetical protein
MVQTSPVATPHPGRAAQYAAAHQAYRALYPALAPTFHSER